MPKDVVGVMFIRLNKKDRKKVKNATTNAHRIYEYVFDSFPPLNVWLS